MLTPSTVGGNTNHDCITLLAPYHQRKTWGCLSRFPGLPPPTLAYFSLQTHQASDGSGNALREKCEYTHAGLKNAGTWGRGPVSRFCRRGNTVRYLYTRLEYVLSSEPQPTALVHRCDTREERRQEQDEQVLPNLPVCFQGPMAQMPRLITCVK